MATHGSAQTALCHIFIGGQPEPLGSILHTRTRAETHLPQDVQRRGSQAARRDRVSASPLER
ncbi:hypothetical protein KL86PLE_40904 [uncultured Pleomorphomonas sp.]|uniref:Uncharacterized protein n=1 Tax=uncultured Pleomorphomonas sp. TaxID=442121 RepID=A0A212LIA1_9HYPH|nr:hypothetical protein KL86PLE_40904 [uncultured Pleomorphomonas sp.]